MRRGIDLVVSALALCAFAPLLIGIGIAVMILDGRPVLYRQVRVGRGGGLFSILKFRTMRPDPSGSKVTSAGDSRVTRLGAVLRRFKLDELPQFLNVLRGDMSLIGPRPEVPEYVAIEDPIWREVLAVRPGITDLASLVFRDEEQLLGPAVDVDAYYRRVILPTKLRLNLTYSRTRSVARDIRLLWMTAVYSVFPGRFDRDHVLRGLAAQAEVAGFGK